MNIETENNSSYYVNIIITQGISIALILLFVLSLKIFSKNEYKKLKSFYEKEICADTSISEVLE